MKIYKCKCCKVDKVEKYVWAGLNNDDGICYQCVCSIYSNLTHIKPTPETAKYIKTVKAYIKKYEHKLREWHNNG